MAGKTGSLESSANSQEEDPIEMNVLKYNLSLEKKGEEDTYVRRAFGALQGN